MPVTVSEAFLQQLFEAIEKKPATTIEVNLPEQTITVTDADYTGSIKQENFEINNYKKTCLLNGYDDIDYLLSMKQEIEQYEAGRTI